MIEILYQRKAFRGIKPPTFKVDSQQSHHTNMSASHDNFSATASDAMNSGIFNFTHRYTSGTGTEHSGRAWYSHSDLLGEMTAVDCTCSTAIHYEPGLLGLVELEAKLKDKAL